MDVHNPRINFQTSINDGAQPKLNAEGLTPELAAVASATRGIRTETPNHQKNGATDDIPQNLRVAGLGC